MEKQVSSCGARVVVDENTAELRLCRNPLCRAELPEGYRSAYCRACAQARSLRYREKNREVLRERSRRYREANPEKARESTRRYYAAHAEEQRKHAQRYREEHRAEVLERSRQYYRENREARLEYRRAYCATHQEQVREAGKRYRISRRGQLAEKCRLYYRDNALRLREYSRVRRVKLHGGAVGHVDEQRLWAAAGGVCVGCNTFTPEELRTVDHIHPISKGGAHTQANVQPLCYRCNASKGSKLPSQWKPKSVLKKIDPNKPHLFNPDWTCR